MNANYATTYNAAASPKQFSYFKTRLSGKTRGVYDDFVPEIGIFQGNSPPVNKSEWNALVAATIDPVTHCALVEVPVTE